MGYQLVDKVWDAQAFKAYVNGLDLSWAKGVTLHHTGTPDLEMRPKGFTIQHMRNLRHYYKVQKGWSAGPHLFIDEDQIFGLSSLESRGVHAVSFNRSHIGIEVLGNYDKGKDDPTTGRGLQSWMVAAQATRILTEKLGSDAINFHRDDPKTSKTCPGNAVDRNWFLHLVSQVRTTHVAKELDDRDDDDRIDPEDEERLEAIAEVRDKP